MRARLLVAIPITAAIILLTSASGLVTEVTPNASIEAGSGNVLFNLSVNNTNSTLNVTSLNITLPQGFSFIPGSNLSSHNSSVFTDSTALFWNTSGPEGLIQNLSSAWFVFNSSVNQTPGYYNLTVIVIYGDNSTNSSVLEIGLNDTISPGGLVYLDPTPSNGSWTNRSWFEVNLSFTELNPESCLLDLDNGTALNLSMSRSGTSCWLNVSGQDQGGLNWTVWINDTSGNLLGNGSWSLNVGPVPHGLSRGSGTLENGSVSGLDWVYVNMTFIEENPHACLLLFDNGTSFSLNMTVNYSQGFCFLNVTNQSEARLNYTFWINNTAGAWNSTGSYYLTLDQTPTIISNRSISSGYDSAVISWETSYPADSRVSYGYGSPDNLSLSWNNASLSSSHSVFLANLSMGLEYFYNITSCDNLSVCNTSGTWNFTTLCIENWTYGGWGECSGGTQSRSAADLNSCGTADNRSSLTRSCDDGSGGGSSGGSGGGDFQPTATKVFNLISPERPAEMEISLSGISATLVRLEASDLISTSNIVVKGYPSKPYAVEVPPRTVHSYLNITTTANKSRVTRAVIEFMVDRSWIESNGITESSVRLMRYNVSHGSWLDLPTVLLRSNPLNLTYRSTSPGFSWFAVTGIRTGNGTGNQSEEQPVPDSLPGTLENATDQQLDEGLEGDVCSANERKCLAGIYLQKCNAWGTGWINEERCFYGCFDADCSESFSLDINYDSIWVSALAVAIIIILAVVYIKRRSIDDFIFWRF